MCLIIYKPAGITITGKQNYKHVFDMNSDGIGYAVRVNKSLIEYQKGVSLNNAEMLFNEIGEKQAVIHFRQATHGIISPKMCHPFPITIHDKKILSLHGFTDAVFFHNGILKDYGDEKFSDTADYVKTLAGFYSVQDLAKTPAIESLKAECNGGKFLLMLPKNITVLIGHFIKDEKTELYYSNESYKWNESYWSDPVSYRLKPVRHSWESYQDHYNNNSLYDNDGMPLDNDDDENSDSAFNRYIQNNMVREEEEDKRYFNF